MLTQILSSDKIKVQNQESTKSLNEIQNSSEQFSKILTSLDAGTETKSDIFKNLEEMFEDDKDFLKESFSFLKGREKEPNLLDSELTENSGIDNLKGSTTILGLNFGNYKEVKDISKEEQNFKVLVNQAKSFLKNELIKKSVMESEMPKTLRGLTQLAESKGISLKDIKFDLGNGETKKPLELGDSKKAVKMVINQHSTEALFRNKTNHIILKAGKTDQTPENLTKSETKGSTGNQIKNEAKPFNLTSLLSEIEETPKAENKSSINLSNNPKSLGDILKSDNLLELAEKNLKKDKVSPKNLGMADKIGKTLNMTPEFVNSLFSEDDMSDLGIDTKKISVNSETEISENHILRETDKLRTGLELKIGEAKTMTRHLASNIQEQIDNYKNPFQKMSLTLNPQKLGEVEIDIIKRGNTVKITLSGNAQTVNLLSANSLDLRTQLINVGLDNPTFKFNEDGRNGNQQQQQQDRKNKDDILAEEEQQETFEIDALVV